MPVVVPGLDLRHEDHRAPVAAAAGDEHLALAGDAALGADELGVAVDAARQIAGDAAAVDDRDRSSVDAVAGEAGDLGDGRVEVGEHLERAVAEHVAPGAGRAARPARAARSMTPSSLREMPTVTVLAWCLIASTGRVSSSIARVSAAHEVVDERARRADLAGAEPGTPRPGGRRARRAAARRGAVGRARLEVAVVACAAQPVVEALGGRRELRGADGRRTSSPTAPAPTARSIASRASRSGRADASIASAAS